MKNIPGPRRAPGRLRPSLYTTALSYSWVELKKLFSWLLTQPFNGLYLSPFYRKEQRKGECDNHQEKGKENDQLITYFCRIAQFCWEELTLQYHFLLEYYYTACFLKSSPRQEFCPGHILSRWELLAAALVLRLLHLQHHRGLRDVLLVLGPLHPHKCLTRD